MPTKTPTDDEIEIRFALDDGSQVCVAWGDRLVFVNPKAQVVACRLKDFSKEDAESRDAYEQVVRGAPSDEHWETNTCLFCGQQILVGPRQQTIRNVMPDDFTLGCLLCASVYVHWVNTLNGGPGDIPARHLGGR